MRHGTLLSLVLLASPIALGNTAYVFDDAPLKKHEAEAKELEKFKEEFAQKPATREALKRRLEVLESLTKAEPEWVDGLWMYGEAAFQYGNSLTNPSDLKEARAIFVKSQAATESCLKKSPTNPLCKLFLGASIGKIASIDGIFSSLKKAERIEKLWLEVVESKIDHKLSKENSLQGSTKYALGIFYRLVPDSRILKWMFGTKGDIEKSVEMHKASVADDGENACNLMMLGVSELCSAKGDTKSEVGKSALTHLARAKSLPVKSALAETCVNDIPEIEKDPGLACGYEASRQQEEKSEAELKKLNADK